jgi:hypothetical protein
MTMSPNEIIQAFEQLPLEQRHSLMERLQSRVAAEDTAPGKRESLLGKFARPDLPDVSDAELNTYLENSIQ